MAGRRFPAVEPPTIEPLVSLPELARSMGLSRTQGYQRLLQLFAEDTRAGRPTDWLVRQGLKHGFRVNVSRFEAAHPEQFRSRRVTREEHEIYAEKLAALEDVVAEMGKRQRAHGASIRELWAVVKRPVTPAR